MKKKLVNLSILFMLLAIVGIGTSCSNETGEKPNRKKEENTEIIEEEEDSEEMEEICISSIYVI